MRSDSELSYQQIKLASTFYAHCSGLHYINAARKSWSSPAAC